jgi:ATP-dependent RNA helicase RhlE
VVYGGVGQQPQVNRLTAGVDIVVATPGRLLDLMSQGYADLGRIEIFVLDEADRMLDMGFAPDVRRVMQKLPATRQSLLFSATMPEAIRSLANGLLRNPVHVAVTPVASTVERVDQRVCHVQTADKQRLLVHLLGRHSEGLVLVFSRTKHGANRLAERLGRDGISAAAIHGNKSQTARQRALEDFRTGRTRVLVATDIAARGIDVKGISVVVNFDLPNEPEAYVHRIGRTARAGAGGLALSLCGPSERAFLRDIQRLIRLEIPIDRDHPFGDVGSPVAPSRPASRPQRRESSARGHGGPGRERHPEAMATTTSANSTAPAPTNRFRGRAPANSTSRPTSRIGRWLSFGLKR